MTDAQNYSGQMTDQSLPPEQELPPREPTPPQSEPQEEPMERLTLDLPLPPQQEEIVLEWDAPNRPFKKRNRQYYTTVAIIVFLISLILFFAGQFLPIAVVIAVAFL